jgi:hypothetical protein
MSGSGNRYGPLDQTRREVENGRDQSSPRNYEALRDTHQQVFDESVSSSPETNAAPRPGETSGSPYETALERIEVHNRQLAALVENGKITPGEKTDRERRFDNQLLSEQKIYDQRQAIERAAAVNEREAQNSQKGMGQTHEYER